MVLRRKKVDVVEEPGYPSFDQFVGDRRGFLGLVGRAAAGLGLAGLVGCDVQGGTYQTGAMGNPDAADGARRGPGPDYDGVELGGVAPADIKPPRPWPPDATDGGGAPDDGGPEPFPWGDDVEMGGVAPVDVEEPWPEDIQMGGADGGDAALDVPADGPGATDTGEPFPPMPGEMPEPDAGPTDAGCTVEVGGGSDADEGDAADGEVEEVPPLGGDMPEPDAGW